MKVHDLTHAGQAELAAALADSDLDRRIDAACAVGDQLRFGEIRALDAVLRDALIAIVEQPEWSDLRFEAAIALCEAGDERGGKLVELLGHKAHRFDAVKALSRLPHERVRQALSALAERVFLPWPDKLVASAACAVLGDRQGARFFERTLVSRWFPSRRAMALHLLGELRHPEALAILSGLIEKRDDPMRHVAIRALGHLGNKAVVGRLQAISDGDVEEDIRYALDLLTP